MVRVASRMSGEVAMNHGTVVMARVAHPGRVQMQEWRGRHADLQAERHEEDEAEPFHLRAIVADKALSGQGLRASSGV